MYVLYLIIKPCQFNTAFRMCTQPSVLFTVVTFFVFCGDAELEQEVMYSSQCLSATATTFNFYFAQEAQRSYMPCYISLILLQGLLHFVSTSCVSQHRSVVLQWKFSHFRFSVWLLCDSLACSSFRLRDLSLINITCLLTSVFFST